MSQLLIRPQRYRCTGPCPDTDRRRDPSRPGWCSTRPPPPKDSWAAVRVAGLPLLIDPLTYYLQDHQAPGTAWSRLPYAQLAALRPTDFTDRFIDQLIDDTVQFQLDHGSTMIIPPYVHVERADSGWTDVQVTLFHRAAVRLAETRVPILGAVAISWRLAAHHTWDDVLEPVLAAAAALPVSELALAVSKADQGTHPDRRLADLAHTVQRVAQIAPVIAWQQSAYGETHVLAGARAYETGIGWRQRCDLQTTMRNQRNQPTPGPRPTPVYIAPLRRSVLKRSLEILAERRALPADFLCTSPGCCPPGVDGLLGSHRREHAVRSRVRQLKALDAIGGQPWRWLATANEAARGASLIQRVNRLGLLHPIESAALQAVHTHASVSSRSVRRRAA